MNNECRTAIAEYLIVRDKRREEIASAHFEGYTVEEIAEYSVYSIKTVKSDIEYIETHREQFLS